MRGPQSSAEALGVHFVTRVAAQRGSVVDPPRSRDGCDRLDEVALEPGLLRAKRVLRLAVAGQGDQDGRGRLVLLLLAIRIGARPRDSTTIEMGTGRRDTNLAGALFTPVQARVLGLLFGQPERTFQSAEIIRLARSGTGAVHRQLARLEGAGLVTVERSGNQKFYRARRESPIYDELNRLVVKTVGVADPLRRALARYRRNIKAAFVYGSVAKRTDRATSDIDLFVLSDTAAYAELFEALQTAESALGRHVNPTVLSTSDWRAKHAGKDSFVSRIASQPELFVIGSERDLA